VRVFSIDSDGITNTARTPLDEHGQQQGDADEDGQLDPERALF